MITHLSTSFYIYNDTILTILTGDATKASATAIANKVGQWRLFSDENHMKNGYWETVYTSLSTAARKTSTRLSDD